jgi:hypothetical protein
LNEKLAAPVYKTEINGYGTTAAADFASGQRVGFVVDKAALGQVFSEYFGFPSKSFHRFLHYHNPPGLTQSAIKWPQCRVNLDSTAHYAN